MTNDDRDTVEVLKAELDFIEKGGYGRSVKSPWLATSIFQDSPTCINFADLERTHPCGECLLIDFVPPESRREVVPCRHIPLNSAGETVDQLELKEDQRGMEEAVRSWVRKTIERLEEQKLARATV
jgi:hypothetical protein